MGDLGGVAAGVSTAGGLPVVIGRSEGEGSPGSGCAGFSSAGPPGKGTAWLQLGISFPHVGAEQQLVELLGEQQGSQQRRASSRQAAAGSTVTSEAVIHTTAK